MSDLSQKEQAIVAITEILSRQPGKEMRRNDLVDLLTLRGFTPAPVNEAFREASTDGLIERIGTKFTQSYRLAESPKSLDYNPRIVIQAPAVIPPGVTYANPMEWALHHCLRMGTQ